MTHSDKVLWHPSSSFIENSGLKKYERWISDNYNLKFDNYSQLWQWSIDQMDQFWESLWKYFGIISDQSYLDVLVSENMPGAKWFEGATVNYAEHIFRHFDKDKAALLFKNEKETKQISWEQLKNEVGAMQNYLISLGVSKGDCVAAYLPNIPHAIVSFLAVNSLGAVWSCCSPDFGVETVIERFAQIKPKVLITVDGYQYNGKQYYKLKESELIRSRIDSVRHTTLVSYLDNESHIENSDNWDDIMKSHRNHDFPKFSQVPFSHPIWVLYSSGTTGKPKAITHSHGGVLLEHLKYMSFHNDVKKGENFFWFTTTGWMMWNFLQASMLVGAIPVIYDGSPGYPSMDAMWQMTEELGIHHFGTSAPYLTACMTKELNPGGKFDLSSLRSIGSTGAPLPDDAFTWIYENVKKNLWLCSMSGGTDVCTAFVGGNPYMRVETGKIQCRALGCALFAYNENGERLQDELGEMVIEKPMPSMPIYFWNDENNERYYSSYFGKYEGKWRHGDWIRIYNDGSLVIHGRSDATLNRKGVRIGTAEIYSVLEKIEFLKDSLIINVELDGGGDIMPLFVVMEEGFELTPELCKEINATLRSSCSPRHVPDKIIPIADIPYTLSGKKMEVPVKKLFMNMDISKSMNRDAIKNPEAMDALMELAETGVINI